jgi:NADH-quinone oxidoreductase subunit C
VAVSLPEGDLQTRLQRYRDGLNNRHGLEDLEILDDVVQVVASPGDVPAVLTTARETLGIPHLSFITVVDREGSFELTYELIDFRGATVRVRTTIEGDEPVIGTVTNVYPTANWHEREAYDMFGVAFAGHPDLRRTYMWQDHFDHHPLLKSFEISTKRTFEGLR